jgi:hypothetical protein
MQSDRAQQVVRDVELGKRAEAADGRRKLGELIRREVDPLDAPAIGKSAAGNWQWARARSA